ncbi:conserved hypothetical protein [Culex quinquefasciatus]|uniref:Uncharacterized protein n=1 Tax=Culex quinquefasciatus TaxID=7176 RepID=B0WXI8_CULQU|nr:conserved hypothetical protein [Culex quinquefasciatus]|eukprot:XP_001862110.1 conserved hypothetical protein [Culex quinquefasciatus]
MLIEQLYRKFGHGRPWFGFISLNGKTASTGPKQRIKPECNKDGKAGAGRDKSAFIQTSGIFSEGLAKRSRYEKMNNSSREPGEAMRRPVLRSEIKVDPEEERKRICDLFGEPDEEEGLLSSEGVKKYDANMPVKLDNYDQLGQEQLLRGARSGLGRDSGCAQSSSFPFGIFDHFDTFYSTIDHAGQPASCRIKGTESGMQQNEQFQCSGNEPYDALTRKDLVQHLRGSRQAGLAQRERQVLVAFVYIREQLEKKKIEAAEEENKETTQEDN